MKSLDIVECEKNFVIEKVLIDDKKQFQRMCELGFVPGQKVNVCKKSILKKVCLVEIRGGIMSVRTELLRGVFVK